MQKTKTQMRSHLNFTGDTLERGFLWGISVILREGETGVIVTQKTSMYKPLGISNERTTGLLKSELIGSSLYFGPQCHERRRIFRDLTPYIFNGPSPPLQTTLTSSLMLGQ